MPNNLIRKGDRTEAHRARSIDELEFSVRARKAITELRVKTIGELCQFMPSDLWRQKNVGPHTIREIEEMLKEMGLALSENPDIAKRAKKRNWAIQNGWGEW